MVSAGDACTCTDGETLRVTVGKSSPFLPPSRLHRCFRVVRKTSPPPLLPPKDQSNMESSLCWGKTFTEQLLQLWSKLLNHNEGALKVLLVLTLKLLIYCVLYITADQFIF